MNNRSPLWIAFVLTFGLVTLGMTGYAAFKLLRHWRLSEVATASIEMWDVVQVGSDAYSLHGEYRFAVRGESYDGATTLNLRCRSRAGAEAALAKAQASEWTVWFYPLSPELNSLEHRFPKKACCYAGILFIALFVLVKGGQSKMRM